MNIGNMSDATLILLGLGLSAALVLIPLFLYRALPYLKRSIHEASASRIILVVALMAASFCCLWVPWREGFRHNFTAVVITRDAGYNWIWSPPETQYRTLSFHSVDHSRVVLPLLGIALAASAGVVLTFKNLHKGSPTWPYFQKCSFAINDFRFHLSRR